MRLRYLPPLIATLSALAAPLPEAADDEPTTVTEGGRRSWQVDGQDREAVRLFWQVRYRASPPSAYWQGDVARCEAGETLPQHRAAMLARMNWFRALAGVPADLEEDPAATRKTQAAALVVAANGQISHAIDASWRCFSADAQEGARTALLGMGEIGPEAVTNFMRDAGERNFGANHRRWLLYPQTRFIGLGDVPQADPARSATGFTAFDGLLASNRPTVRHEFVAWPPPGWVPYSLVFPRWSFSLPEADFSAATVALTLGDRSVPVQIEPADSGAGEPTLVWRLGGMAHDANWPKPHPASSYRVRIDNVKQAGQSRNFDYTVQVFDPDEVGIAHGEARLSGPGRAPPSGAGFTVLAQAGATGAQWRALRIAPWQVVEGAEQGYGLLSYSGSNQHPVLQDKVVASGKQAFRLAHRHIGDEVLILAEPLAVGRAATLRFQSRRGIAGADEIARVEVKVEGRDGWEALYEQRSDGQPSSAEKAFTERKLDLSAYADRLVQLRFRYQFAQGDFFAPDDERVGWYLDDIRFEGVSRVLQMTEPAAAQAGRFIFQPAAVGDWCLQARPTVYRAPGDYGPLLVVHVEKE